MMPRLTIGIPHKDRSDYLQLAIASCLCQKVPVHVLVADQGHTDETAAIMASYTQHPHVEHLLTNATCIRDNWEQAARGCDTEFFAWLQDDDELTPIYSYRVLKAFDAFPRALHWQAFCHCSPDRIHYIKGALNGPQVGVRRDLAPEMWGGHLLLASMYILSWALSPGVAFRCGQEFNDSLAALPYKCDLFQERLILAEMGLRGPWVADGVIAGYWIHHGQNESYAQNMDGSIGAQRKILIDRLDDLLDHAETWREQFLLWCRMYSPINVMGWLRDFEAKESRYAAELQSIMRDSLEGRVETIPGSDRGENGPGLLWTPADLRTTNGVACNAG